MKEGCKHLTYTERLTLDTLLKAKKPVKEIASIMHRHISSIYREIKRGAYSHLESTSAKYGYVNRYSPYIAEKKYRDNLKEKGSGLKIGNDLEYANYIENKIVKDKLSPDAVLGEIKHLGLVFNTSICTSTLYSYIYKGVFYKLTMKYLPNHGKTRKKNKKVYCKSPAGISIEQRPRNILERHEFGHWEMDCVCGSTNSSLLVLTERQTRKEIIFKLRNQQSVYVVSCLNKLEKYYGKRFRSIFKTITVDNGSEFRDVEGLEKSIYNGKRVQMYYCHPYCSSERGSNERMNREIRRKIPKGSNIEKYSDLDIKKIEEWLNNYPRRILNYASSEELFKKQLEFIIG